ncbi:MAG: hypothetical protein ACJASM_003326 [Salibacteraceae bacterium]|jgi:hypothetical protein
MKRIILILIFIPELLFGQEGLITKRTTEITNLRETLEKNSEVEFGGGDVWGTTFYYANADSTQIRIVAKYDAGDYGNGEVEFFVFDDKLVFQKEYILDWLVKGNQDGQNYKLRETIYCFSNDGTGLKTSKHTYTTDLKVSTENRRKLNEAITETQILEIHDYTKQRAELTEVMKRELIKD